MLLYVSLKGEAEEELEWCDIKKINADNGAQYIVDTLRQPLMTRSVYLKRKYLHEYEYVQRQANEPIRSFCNRYGRIERSLKSVNINVEGMYDGESRGARLLERMRLGLEQQRLILVASNQSLEFDTIREAAQIQFPDHRPTPQVVFNREFDGEKRQEPSSQRATTPQPQHRSQKGSGKGSKGQGKGKSHPGSSYKSTAYVTEIAENNAQTEDDEETYQEEQPAEDDAEEEELATIQEADEEGGEQEEDLVADLAEVARCLTVTARRLQGMTLGRKFTGGSKTIAQRKAETHCAVCGMKGHWQGDSECPQSGNSNGGKGGKTSTPGNKKPEAKGQAKKVMTVTYGNGRREIPINDTPEETYGTRFQTFMIRSSIPNKVLANNITSFKEYMVLDTACQRTCCSTKWYKEWSKEVKQRGLHALEVVSQEPFEFGHGPTQYSHTHAYLPVNFDHQVASSCLLGTQVINATNDIPLLGSCDLMKEMQTIIDMPNQEVRFQAINVTVPLEVVNGHVAVKITNFPDETSMKRKVWQDLITLSQSEGVDPEFVRAIRISSAPSSSSERSRDAKSTTSMAPSMASLCNRVLQRGVLPGKSDDPGLQASSEAKGMDRIPRSNVDGGEGAIDGKSNRSLSSRPDQAVRKQIRPLQQMSPLQQEMGVVRREKPVGASRNVPKQAATALTILFNGSGIHGQPIYTGSINGFEPHSQVIHGFDNFGRSQDPSSWCQTEDACQENTQIPSLRGGNVGGLRMGLHRFFTSEGMNSFFTDKAYVIKNPEALEDEDTLDDAEAPDEIYLTDFVKGEPTSFKIPENVKSGNKAWIAGHLKSQRKTYENEINAYKSLLSHQECVKEGTKTDMMVLDLIEVFAGKARLTDLAHRYGLSASQPFDIKYGIDLKTKAGRDMLKKAVKTLKPLLLLVAWPCTVWNIFNRNMNYSYRLDELESLRDEDRPLVKLGVELCYEQIEGGRFYLGENPLRSDLWKESHVCQLRQHADNIEVTGDAGAYGAENRDGWPTQKPHRWITNSKTLAENLSKKMTPEQKLYTKPVEGKETAPSGEYCDGLVNAILAGLQQEAKARNPQRFHAQKNSAKVFYVKPFHDEDAWKDILDEAERRFTNTYKKPIILGESDELMPKIQQLVPWEISRVQLAWTPAARRWPIDVSFTHRGCALRTMPGAFRLEHEDENSVKYPQQRFTESIRVGIFFYMALPARRKRRKSMTRLLRQEANPRE